MATHLIPLPHISASDPSALMMRMVMSVPSPGMTYRTPSAPMPKWRSHIASHHLGSMTTPPFVPSIRMKSLPRPWYFQNLISGASRG